MARQRRDKIPIYVSDSKSLTLERTLPYIDECKVLIALTIKQAKRDYCNFYLSQNPAEQEMFSDAEAFIFQDYYKINWGGRIGSLADFLDILDIDIVWFRERTLRDRDLRTKRTRRKKEESDEQVSERGDNTGKEPPTKV